MSVCSLSKVRIILHTSARYPFLNFLQEKGYFEFNNVSQVVEKEIKSYFEKENAIFDYELAQLDFAITNITKYAAPVKTSFRNMLLGGKHIISSGEMHSIIRNFHWKEVVTKCEDLSGQINEAENKIKKAENEIKILEPWKKLKVNLSQKLETETVKFVFLQMGEGDFTKAKIALEKSKATGLQKIGYCKSTICAFGYYLKEQESEYRKIREEIGFEEISLSVREGTPEEEIIKMNELKLEMQSNVDKAQKELSNLGKDLPKIKVVYDYLLNEYERQKARRAFFHSESVAIINGWMPEKALNEVRLKLEELSGNEFVLEEAKLVEGEEMPVELENKGVIWPFEAVTSVYGLPRSNEPDPTGFLAPFFIVFFALCLTDAAYGLMLSILCFGALKFFKIPKANKKLFVLLGWGGIFTFFAGVLFGGWFGMTPEQAPSFLIWKEANGTSHFNLQVIDPLRQTLNFLILSFGFGIVHILTGIGVKAYWMIRNGEMLDAILGPVLWILTIVCGLASIFFGSILLNLCLVGVVLLVLTQGRSAWFGFGKKSLVGKIFTPIVAFLKGFLSLYDVVGYTSDVLSYSRLMALGLGTGIIAMAVNLIANIVLGMIPYVGIIFAIIILIIGHLGNLALSGLGAFIHSGRLQYVEFFGKFMEGGGKAFKPLREKRKFTISNVDFD